MSIYADTALVLKIRNRERRIVRTQGDKMQDNANVSETGGIALLNADTGALSVRRNKDTVTIRVLVGDNFLNFDVARADAKEFFGAAARVVE